MTTTITLDSHALRVLADLVWNATGDGRALADAIGEDLRRLARAAAEHDAAHPDDPCVWALHPLDAEPSPFLRIETRAGLVSIDVRTLEGPVHVDGPHIRWLFGRTLEHVELASPEQAQAALDRIDAARVAHDDAHAEDRRHALVAEAVGKAVASELRLADLPKLIREAIERLTAAPEPEQHVEPSKPAQQWRIEKGNYHLCKDTAGEHYWMVAESSEALTFETAALARGYLRENLRLEDRERAKVIPWSGPGAKPSPEPPTTPKSATFGWRIEKGGLHLCKVSDGRHYWAVSNSSEALTFADSERAFRYLIKHAVTVGSEQERAKVIPWGGPQPEQGAES